MTLLPDMQPMSNGVLITLDDGHVLEVRTATQARQYGDLFREAEVWIDEQVRERGTRLDREQGPATNAAFAEVNKEWGTLPSPFQGNSSPATTGQKVIRIDSNPCAPGDVA